MKFYYTDSIEIELTANRSDEEPFRLYRLHCILGFVCCWWEPILVNIAKLHDHKGNLEVTWKVSPSKPERYAIEEAWKSVIGDGSDNVEHKEINPF